MFLQRISDNFKEQTENILNSSEKKPLPELPLEKFLDKKRKWTENEKINQSVFFKNFKDIFLNTF